GEEAKGQTATGRRHLTDATPSGTQPTQGRISRKEQGSSKRLEVWTSWGASAQRGALARAPDTDAVTDAACGRPSRLERAMRFILRRLQTQLTMLHGGSRRRRWVLGTTLLGAVAAIALFVVSAGAIVANSPSNFEANDGNMTVQTAKDTDWNCFANGN